MGGKRHRTNNASTGRFATPTVPDKSPNTLIVKNEFRNRPRDICVAHERQCAVIEYEPLTIDPDCRDSMIFIWETVPQHDDLHRIACDTSCQQRRLFDDRIRSRRN
jgi:hypothetical protein